MRAFLVATLLLLGGACAAPEREDTVLDMKPACERCEGAVAPDPAPGSEAWICSFECTFCTPCTTAMNRVCPNCGGELVVRPRRVAKD